MPCVYTTPAGLCDGKAPLSPTEHYLPRALGNFQGDERLVDRICNNCHGYARSLKTCSHTTARRHSSESGWSRGKENHKGKNIFYEPTFGIPPLAILGNIRAMTLKFFGSWFLIRRTPETESAPR